MKRVTPKLRIIRDISEMRQFSLTERRNGREIILVPTMGALHKGHEALIRKGAGASRTLIVSIFVNPTQFAEGEDFGTYPRDLEADALIAKAAGADALFCPSAEDIYPQGFQSYLDVGGADGLSARLCGVSRPGHFRGVATVVLKLFNICAPDKAVFGLKDYQQFAVIKRMADDLNLDIDIIGVETVREQDGLALSSRNNTLNPAQRKAAGIIPVAMEAGRKLFIRGERKSPVIIREVKKYIEKEPQAVIDYIEVSDLETLTSVEYIGSSALLSVAINFGQTRLIDNIELALGYGGIDNKEVL